MRSFFKCCIVLLVLSNTVYAQSWLWSRPQNISSAAYLQGNVKLGSSGNLVSYLTDNVSTYFIFTDGTGEVIWDKHIENLIVKDLIVDAYDNIYFAGSFAGGVDIAGNKFESQGSTDAIVGMFDKSGTLVKANAFGTVTEESANSIAVNGQDIFVTGHFTDAQSVNAVSLFGDGKNRNTFVLKLDPDLTAIRGIESSSQGSSGIKIAVDKFDAVYVLGNSNTDISVGSNAVTISENGQYILKLTPDLGVTWLQAIIEHGANGYFRPFILFDLDANFVLGRVTGGGGGNDHAISVEKYDPLGTQMWKAPVKVNLDNYLDMDPLYNVYVAGGYVEFNGDYSLSIAKVSPTGNTSTVIFDEKVEHRIKGLAANENSDFYINYSCVEGAPLAPGMECEQGSVFMARYGSNISTAIADRAFVNSLKIHPNPSNGIVEIRCTSCKKQNAVLLVKNNLGQIIYLDPMSNIEGEHTRAIDLSSQPKGIYFIEMRSGNESSVEKIVFQ
jgi:hypothetical protein